MRWQHLHQAAYGLWFLMPLTPVLAIWSQSLRVPGSVAAWLPLLVLYGIYPLIQVALPFKFPELDGQAKKSRSWILLYRFINVLSMPLAAVMLISGVVFWTSAQLSPLNAAAYVVGIGAFNSFISLSIGHELLHGGNHTGEQPGESRRHVRSHPWNHPLRSRVLAAIALSTACFGVFAIAHIQRHHRFVGTAKDHHTARKDESLYAFITRALIHEALTALRWTRRLFYHRIVTRGDSVMTLATALSFTWATLFFLGWGWRGLAFFLIQSAACIVFVEWANYLQHYGIKRIASANGQLPPVAEWHAWNEDLWLSDIYMLGVLRHADHHVNPGKPHLCLSKSDLAPSYPLPFTMMMGISMIPPLFFRIAGRILESHPLLSQNSK